jgi:NAD(P)H-hydrate epimerase
VQPVVTVDEMRAIDAEAHQQVPEAVLIERAGTALATRALALLGGGYGRRVVVLAGRGNNGADGVVAASVLASREAHVQVVAAAEAPAVLGVGADLVIDAAYGTGFHGDYVAPEVPDDVPVLACDIPSGVHGDTGQAHGRPLAAVATVTFAAHKPGLLQGDGVELAGEVTVADIGLDCRRAHTWLVEDADIAAVPGRAHEAHKWQAAVAVVAGSPGMTGAASLCAHAAYRAGAGMVRLGVPGATRAEVPFGDAVGEALPAVGWADRALRMAERCHVVVVGPGLGASATTAAEVRRLVVHCPVPVVVDADGLRALGDVPAATAVLAGRPAATVLTPHGGEQARLTGQRPGPDRIGDARSLAGALGATVLLKGSTTAVGDPDGSVLVVRSGSSRLATAGTGDVLSGVIAAFIARGAPPTLAAALAAHAHGRAASLGLAVGATASDLPLLVAQWLSAQVAPSAPVAQVARTTQAAQVTRTAPVAQVARTTQAAR